MNNNIFKPVQIKKNFVKNAYRADCERIQQALMEHGHYATIEQCQELWEMYSEAFAAGWLLLPEDNIGIYICIRDYIE
jgi:hypothetical protein